MLKRGGYGCATMVNELGEQKRRFVFDRSAEGSFLFDSHELVLDSLCAAIVDESPLLLSELIDHCRVSIAASLEHVPYPSRGELFCSRGMSF